MLRFLSFFLGPVFAKEMVEMARRKRYYFNRILYGVVLLFTMWIVWQEHHYTLRRGTVSIRDMAQFAESMFHAVSAVQYAAVFLFVPLFLCGVIASEREEGTLDLLFTTQLRDREIVLGKLASRTVALVMLILCALPIMSMITLFGGVDPDALLRVQASTLLAVLFAGAHAIYFSSITKSPMGALVRTYWWMAVYLLGVPAVTVMILSGVTRGPTAPFAMSCLAGLFMTNPIAPFIAAMEGFTYNQMATYIGVWFYPASFVVPAGISCLLLWRAVSRVRLPPSPFALLIKRLAPVRAVSAGVAVVRVCSAPFRMLQVPLRWVRNPIWLRARRTRVYDREGYIGRIQWFAWLAALFFLLLILIFHRTELTRTSSSVPFLIIGWIGVLALTVILSGSSLVGDRRRGFLDLVLMSPITPREVIDGTLLAIWQHMGRIYSLIVVLMVFFGCTGASTWPGLFCSFVTATLFCALAALYGVVFSLSARTLPGALVPTFLFPVIMNIGVVFLMPTFREASGPALWILSGLALAVTWYWTTRRANMASISSYYIAVHLVITSIAECWTWKQSSHWEFPIAAAHPGFLAIAPLDSNPYRSTGWWYGDFQKDAEILVCYWSALIVNFIWVRWSVIRNFERFAERTDHPARSAFFARLFRKKAVATKMDDFVEAAPLKEPVTDRI